MQWGAECFEQGPEAPCLLYLIRHNCAAALAQGKQGWGRCKSHSQAVPWGPSAILRPGAPSSHFWEPPPCLPSLGPGSSRGGTGEAHSCWLEGDKTPDSPAMPLFCCCFTPFLPFPLLFGGILLQSDTSAPSQQLVITHWTFGRERGGSGLPSTWRKRPLLPQEARPRDMELPCLCQDGCPASICPGC